MEEFEEWEISNSTRHLRKTMVVTKKKTHAAPYPGFAHTLSWIHRWRKIGRNAQTLSSRRSRLIIYTRSRNLPWQISPNTNVSISHGHNTNKCIQLKDVIEWMIKKGKLTDIPEIIRGGRGSQHGSHKKKHFPEMDKSP